MIYVTGDTHANIDLKKLKVFKDKNILGENDFLIICGDFGGVWYNNWRDDSVLDFYKECPWTTLFVDGNHENHDALDAMPVEFWNGGKVHKLNDNLIHLMRGQVFLIDGYKIFTFGGAQSHDMWCRKEGESWWAREMPSDEEYEEGFRNLEKAGNEVDYVITHCAPDKVQNSLGFAYRHYQHNKLTNYLEIVRQTIKFKAWYFGHYHTDNDLGKFHILYDDIIELGDRIYGNTSDSDFLFDV